MIVTVCPDERRLFQKAVATVAQFTASASTEAILTAIKLTVPDDETLEIRATDRQREITYRVSPVYVEQRGSAVVSGRLLLKIVKGFSDGDVTIYATDEMATISNARSTYQMNVIDPELFPDFSEMEPEQSLSIPCSTLRSMVDKACKTVARDKLRPLLEGICVSAADGRLKLLSTDGYRMSIVDEEIDGSTTFDVVVLAKGLVDMLNAVDARAAVELSADEGKVMLRTSGVTFVTSRIVGNFPNLMQYVERSPVLTTLTLDAREAIEAVRKVLVMVEIQTVRLRMVDGDTELLSVSTYDARHGRARDLVPVERVGDRFEVAVNGRYLMDALDAAGKTAVIEYRGENQMLVVRSEEVGYSCVLAPIRL